MNEHVKKPEPPRTEEEALNRQIAFLSDRIQRIAELEAEQASRGGGPAARGAYSQEKARCIASIDKHLDELEALYKR